MIYIIRTLVLTLVEVLCCRIFFDTFLKRKEQRHHMDKVVLLVMWIQVLVFSIAEKAEVKIPSAFLKRRYEMEMGVLRSVR